MAVDSRQSRARTRQMLRHFNAWCDIDAQAVQVVCSVCNLLDRASSFTLNGSAEDAKERIGVLASFPGLEERLLAKHLGELERMARLLRQLFGQLTDTARIMDQLADDEWRASAFSTTTATPPRIAEASLPGSGEPLLCMLDLTRSVASEMWRKGLLLEAMEFGDKGRSASWRRRAPERWPSGVELSGFDAAAWRRRLEGLPSAD